MLHYSPTGATIGGEPPGIWAFLGTDRLAAPIGEVPVYNVSVPVIGREFCPFELEAGGAPRTPIH